MTLEEVMKALESFSNEQTKKTYLRHGAKEPFFGAKVSDLKTIVKKVKKNYQLALDLYDTGNSDAMYLAGLIADESKMTKADLQKWVKGAYWYMLSDFTVPWVASESKFGLELAKEWIESTEELIASAGWSTFSSLSSVRQDADLDIDLYSKLLDRVAKEIHQAPNRVRNAMNGFVIAVGGNIAALTDKAIKTAEKIGAVSVDVGDTACKVPLATEYIQKIKDKGKIGTKRKTARC